MTKPALLEGHVRRTGTFETGKSLTEEGVHCDYEALSHRSLPPCLAFGNILLSHPMRAPSMVEQVPNPGFWLLSAAFPTRDALECMGVVLWVKRNRDGMEIPRAVFFPMHKRAQKHHELFLLLLPSVISISFPFTCDCFS